VDVGSECPQDIFVAPSAMRLHAAKDGRRGGEGADFGPDPGKPRGELWLSRKDFLRCCRFGLEF
jgi:hypothetical protein